MNSAANAIAVGFTPVKFGTGAKEQPALARTAGLDERTTVPKTSSTLKHFVAVDT